MSIFTGAGCAIITPFTAEGAVDYPALDRLLDFQIDNGTDAIIICGTTGESSTLSEAEHSDVIAHTVKYVNHRVPVIAGTGSNDTQTAIMLSKQAEDDGAEDHEEITKPLLSTVHAAHLLYMNKANAIIIHTLYPAVKWETVQIPLR